MVRHGSAVLTAAIMVVALGSRPVAAQWGSFGGGSPPPADVQYIMDENGNYTGKKMTITGGNTSGTHYSCRPGANGYTCRPCSECHTSTQVVSKTFLGSYDWNRHSSVYFPKLVARLQPGQRIAWGSNSMVAYRNSGVVVTSLEKIPRDLVIFPTGSLIVRNQAGRASFVVLPRTGEPVAVRR